MFEGAYTAIVTPFAENNEIDEEKLRELVHFQIEGGVDGIVPCGTTGESPTLTMAEHEKVIKAVIEEAKGKVKVIAGTGSNNTVEAVHLTKKAAEFGADGALVIMPYYNKPMPEGQFLHFKSVSEAGGIPVVVYNVPGRTGKSILPEDMARMFEKIDNIVALKDAVGDIEYTCAVRSLCDIEVLSGDDSMTFPMMAVGGKGIISVASNIVPDRVSSMVKAAASGDFDSAREQHFAMWDLFKGLFVETNPIPVKTALIMMGKISGGMRLPLSEMEQKNQETLRNILEKMNIL
ncbi:4-hydroxy-tetrahydrodipicolinate synthase [Planctomycetota bacterium]